MSEAAAEVELSQTSGRPSLRATDVLNDKQIFETRDDGIRQLNSAFVYNTTVCPSFSRVELDIRLSSVTMQLSLNVTEHDKEQGVSRWEPPITFPKAI
jgi:hypothetical protein